MKKWAALIGILLCIVAAGCDSAIQEEEPVTSSEQDLPAELPSEELPVLENTAPVLLGIVVNRKHTHYSFENITYDNIQNSSDYARYRINLIRDIIDLKWMVLRSGCGDDEPYEAWSYTPYTNVSELPVIQQSNSIAAYYGFETTGPADDTWVADPGSVEVRWVRLVWEPYYEPHMKDLDDRPMCRKDWLVYIEPDNPQNAILAEQHADRLDEWHLFTLPGFGPWLAKEIDMLYRQNAYIY